MCLKNDKFVPKKKMFLPFSFKLVKVCEKKETFLGSILCPIMPIFHLKIALFCDFWLTESF